MEYIKHITSKYNINRRIERMNLNLITHINVFQEVKKCWYLFEDILYRIVYETELSTKKF